MTNGIFATVELQTPQDGTVEAEFRNLTCDYCGETAPCVVIETKGIVACTECTRLYLRDHGWLIVTFPYPSI